MITTRNIRRCALPLSLAFGLLTAGVAQAQTTFQVTVTTPSLATTTGGGDILYFFNPAGTQNPSGSTALPATVTLSNITYVGYMGGAYVTLPIGTATNPSGTPATGAITNDQANGATNGIDYNFSQYGASLDFTVTFSGPALSPGAMPPADGSDFFVQLFDGSQNSILTNDPEGRVLDISYDGSGQFTTTTFPPNADGSGVPAATIIAVPVVAPEPDAAVCWLVGAGGLVALAAARRRKALS